MDHWVIRVTDVDPVATLLYRLWSLHITEGLKILKISLCMQDYSILKILPTLQDCNYYESRVVWIPRYQFLRVAVRRYAKYCSTLYERLHNKTYEEQSLRKSYTCQAETVIDSNLTALY